MMVLPDEVSARLKKVHNSKRGITDRMIKEFIRQCPAFHNDLITELTRLCGIEHSFATAYSSEENGIVERANQDT